MVLVEREAGDRKASTEAGSTQLSAELLSSMAPIDLPTPKEKEKEQ